MRIIRSTLEAARHPEHEREPVALDHVAQRVADLKSFDLGRDGITLSVNVPPTLPPVLGSPFQLQQVLLNLVANAQDALRDQSGERAIAVRATAEGDAVILEVRDTGPGIPAEALPHVFEPFYTTKTTGTGLGLAISAGIAQRLGGRLSVTSTPGGAIFRLSLPAAA
jgi:C4-dicarboxylate-specific signal transduction histidine kinase